MMLFKRLCALLFLLACAACDVHAYERIADFSVVVTVGDDGHLDVVETIHVISEGQQIKRGIVRELPTTYWDQLGTRYSVDFMLNEVTHHGAPVRHRIESATNGISLFIGDPDVFISRGRHVYTIAYTINRQIGYFHDHDELFWNITGNGWRLPIDQVNFHINLPKTIPTHTIKTIGYTGYEGDCGNDYIMHEASDSTITGRTTRALRAYEGLSVAVAWPKGYVAEPTFFSTIYYFMRDMLLLLLLALIIFGCIGVYFFTWLRTAPLRRSGTIIPLFYPPGDVSPAQIACIDAMGYTSKAITASLVQLAVKGIITIEAKKNLITATPYYVLNLMVSRESDAFLHLDFYEAYLARRLFANERVQCNLNDTVHAQAFHDFKVQLERHFTAHDYIETHAELLQSLVIGSVCMFALIGVYAINGFTHAWIMDGWFWIAAVIMAAVHYAGASLIQHYTVKGRALKDTIDGFKLFLETTEKDRIAIIGTPPEQTPELYETYLPYAIALGVEEQWSAKFEALFARMQASGNRYVPRWYVGNSFYHYAMFNTMTTTMHARASTTIAAGHRPGSRSGFGGGGGAGRGGGGGGGGGW